VNPVSAHDGTVARAVPVRFQWNRVAPSLVVNDTGGVANPVWLEYR
jgi:hypothetical protein